MKKLSAKLTSAIAAAALTVGLAACSASGGGANSNLSIATGGSSGVFYVLGAGMADIVSSNDSGLTLQAQATAATEENLRLVQSSNADFAFSVYDAAVDAYNGAEEYGQKYDNVRLVMPGHVGYQHVIVMANSDVQSFSELGSKRLGISPGRVGEKLAGAVGSPSGTPFESMNTLALSYREQADALKDGTIDAASILAGLPASAVVELKTGQDIRIVSLTPEEQEKILEENPSWTAATIPADVYGTEEDIVTFAVPYVIVANKDVAPEAVYEFMDKVYSNGDRVQATHAEGKAYAFDNPLFEQDPLIPWHEGAQQYINDHKK
ncbi:TAXI family TRAP transporter solute-binding subunit [Corynebacterium riegelii]|uniref:TAXI family TRAP transporter solute-binding subunit n=1 Tax=Corynebacterium riegelii TaxID=156976 RepID=UPI002551C539|nr:TAXI family TRAP transporter solute-binding subunit [Corynebacterium riegelii]MDK7181423.1 TAXI family TRAP transporter solute-binding subunit [Corynebacterium riegelii]